MRRVLALVVLCLSITQVHVLATLVHAQSAGTLDQDIPNGHFYTQTNGSPLGSAPGGYSVTDDDGITFWDTYQRLGGPSVLGYPVTSRFTYDGFVNQAMQKAVFQWRPDTKQVYFLNTFDALHDKGKDDWLLAYRQTPKPFDTSPDTGLSWDQVVARHLSFLDQNQAIKQLFLSDPSWMDHYGLPVSYADEGNSFVIRAQRATFQYWKEDVPWAKAGEVTVANGGDLAKEAGLWPDSATALTTPDGKPVQQALAIQPAPTATPQPTPPPAPTAAPMGPRVPGVYYARSPEYGVHTLLMGSGSDTPRILQQATEAGFTWVKVLLQWGQIEHDAKGKYDWGEADRVVKMAAQSGVKLIARIDQTPDWARLNHNGMDGPPDDLKNYADFVNALVSRYRTGSPYGHVDAIEIWNEPNLTREWGNLPPDPVRYVQMLAAANNAAKMADPSVTVISAGLSPTETNDATAIPDNVYLQKMYDAGAKGTFDVLGVHAPGFKAPPEMSPAQVAADPNYGGHRFFTFRRVEDLRDIMVRNGDSGRQIWLTEFGWTSDQVHPAYSWFAVTEQQKADYLVRAFEWARNNWSPWIGVMVVWNLPLPYWGPQHEEYWWSITDPDGTPRPAYLAIKDARHNGTLP